MLSLRFRPIRVPYPCTLRSRERLGKQSSKPTRHDLSTTNKLMLTFRLPRVTSTDPTRTGTATAPHELHRNRFDLATNLHPPYSRAWWRTRRTRPRPRPRSMYLEVPASCSSLAPVPVPRLRHPVCPRAPGKAENAGVEHGRGVAGSWGGGVAGMSAGVCWKVLLCWRVGTRWYKISN